jgi:pSer/pThr/pTyr-binding forkhead associated (FHA) protein
MVGQVISLDADEVVVGRDPIGLRYHHPVAAVIYLPFLAINRYHAHFRRIGEGYVLEDMQSRNGTSVNGVRIQTATLCQSDRIRMVDFEFVFRTFEVQQAKGSGTTQQLYGLEG